MVTTLDPSFNPQTSGGVPFCSSGSLGTILCYPPSFLKSAYDFPEFADGTGSTIVIVDAFGSPTIQSDLNTFDSTFGIPATTVTILCGPTWTGSEGDVCPTSESPNAGLCGYWGWAEETTLDVDMSHALAPGAHIVVVEANDCFDTSLYGAEMAVVSQGRYAGSIMSQSFGEPDDLVTCTVLNAAGTKCLVHNPALLNLPNKVFSTAAKNGWTVIASSGDDGANEDLCVLTCSAKQLDPSFPATNPMVLAAGGTQGNPYGGDYGPPPGEGGTFSCPASTYCNTGLVVVNGGETGCTTAARPGVPSSCYPVGYGGEGAWNEFYWFGLRTSTGGGVSQLYGKPAYQTGLPQTTKTLLGQTITTSKARTVPDVSFNSAIYGGFLAYLGFLGRWAVFGGTSAASPAWAGIVALLVEAHGSPVGFLNPAIYGLGMSRAGGSAFHDITSGENSDTAGFYKVDGYVAGKGYDLTTGWGTPDVTNFIFDIMPFLA